MICAWIDTSSAETGSSQTISTGSIASARAMPTRWRCPPDIWCGKRSACCGSRPTCATQLAHAFRARALLWHDAVHLERLVDHLADGHARVERGVGVLEDHLDAPAHGAQRCRIERRHVDALEQDPAARRLLQLQDAAAGGGFAAARFAHQAQGLAAAQILKLTPSTARTVAAGPANIPPPTSKCLTRLSTSRMKSSLMPHAPV